LKIITNLNETKIWTQKLQFTPLRQGRQLSKQPLIHVPVALEKCVRFCLHYTSPRFVCCTEGSCYTNGSIWCDKVPLQHVSKNTLHHNFTSKSAMW